MAMYTSTSGVGAVIPEQVAELLVQPVTEAALALNPACVTLVSTTSRSIKVPVLREDPSAAWVAEGAEITPDDSTFDEIEIVPRKVAGLTIVSRELAEDSSPEAAQIVGEGLARDIAAQVDRAFFAQPVLASPAPPGLGSITPTIALAGATFEDLDMFAGAVSTAETLGTSITSWVTSPATALELATMKVSDDARVPLLSLDPAQPARRTIEGLPLLVSPRVKAGVVWGLPSSRVITALRSDATIDTSNDAYFSSDRVAIRATMRVGFGMPHPAAVVRIEKS